MMRLFPRMRVVPYVSASGALDVAEALTNIRAGREMSTAAAVRAVSAVVATPGRRRSRVHSRAVRASASTMSAPMKVSEAAEQAPAIPPPAHPTYSIADAIRLALEEDIADVGDISSLSTCVSL